MKRLFMGIIWFVVFWIGGSVVMGGIAGGIAGAGAADAGAAAAAGGQAAQELGERYGGLLMMLAAFAAVGGTVTGVLPGTQKERSWT